MKEELPAARNQVDMREQDVEDAPQLFGSTFSPKWQHLIGAKWNRS